MRLKLDSQFYVFLRQQHWRPLKTILAHTALLCRVVQLPPTPPPKCTVALLVLCITLLFWCLGLMAVMAYFPSCSIFVAVPKAIKNIFVTAQKKKNFSLCLFLFNISLIFLPPHEADVFCFFPAVFRSLRLSVFNHHPPVDREPLSAIKQQNWCLCVCGVMCIHAELSISVPLMPLILHYMWYYHSCCAEW